VAQAEDERSFYETPNGEPAGDRVEVGHLEVIADVEARIWHEHTTDQRRQGGLAVEWMRPTYHKAGFNSPLVGFSGIECWHELAHRRTFRVYSGFICRSGEIFFLPGALG
jgi:hypothetical protein